VIFLERAVTGDGLWTGIEACGALRASGLPLAALCRGGAAAPRRSGTSRAPQAPLDDLPEVREALRGAERELAGRGRVSLRYSGTEPLARIMVEGPTRSARGGSRRGSRRRSPPPSTGRIRV